MTYLLKKILLVMMLVMLLNVVFIQLLEVDMLLLKHSVQALLIALCLQPWVIRQLTY